MSRGRISLVAIAVLSSSASKAIIHDGTLLVQLKETGKISWQNQARASGLRILHDRNHIRGWSNPSNPRKRLNSIWIPLRQGNYKPRVHTFCSQTLCFSIVGLATFGIASGWDADPEPQDVQRVAEIKFSACRRLVSVSVAPLNIRAISRTRSTSSIRRMSVCVRPRDSLFSIRKC